MGSEMMTYLITEREEVRRKIDQAIETFSDACKAFDSEEQEDTDAALWEIIDAYASAEYIRGVKTAGANAIQVAEEAIADIEMNFKLNAPDDVNGPWHRAQSNAARFVLSRLKERGEWPKERDDG
jgi:hypothetical protein